jgi:beta-phosphoglucomutase-like phosphatase (HAD superfamily)
MTPDPVLDAVIRHARHLLFSFDGPIRRTDTGEPVDSNAPTAPYIHEVLVACNESGRTASAISTKPPIDIPAYLDAHDLFTQITVIAVSVPDAINFIKATPDRCLLVTSSTDDIKAAQAARTPSIGYARTPDDAPHLVDAGAVAFVYSMADVALRLRALPVDFEH